MDAFNIAQYLPERARSAPDRLAVLCPHQPDRRGRTRLTFAELNRESDDCARGLVLLGLTPGCRTLLSEDLQHGQRIDGLRIVDPFR